MERTAERRHWPFREVAFVDGRRCNKNNEPAGEPFNVPNGPPESKTVEGLLQRHADIRDQFGFRRAVRTIAVDFQGRRGTQPLAAVGKPFAEDLSVDFRQSGIRSDMANHGVTAARDGLEADSGARSESVVGLHGDRGVIAELLHPDRRS